MKARAGSHTQQSSRFPTAQIWHLTPGSVNATDGALLHPGLLLSRPHRGNKKAQSFMDRRLRSVSALIYRAQERLRVPSVGLPDAKSFSPRSVAPRPGLRSMVYHDVLVTREIRHQRSTVKAIQGIRTQPAPGSSLLPATHGE
jgi:hypothetical protein